MEVATFIVNESFSATLSICSSSPELNVDWVVDVLSISFSLMS